MLGVELLGNRGLPVHSDEDNQREREREKQRQLKNQTKFVNKERKWFQGRTDLKERERERRRNDGFSYPFISVTATHHLSIFVILIQHGVKAKQEIEIPSSRKLITNAHVKIPSKTQLKESIFLLFPVLIAPVSGATIG